MNSKQCLIVVLACLAATVIANRNDLYQHHSNKGLLNFMSRSNTALQSNPERSLDCFNYYLPLLNKLGEEYEIAYSDCVNASANGRIAADEATLEQRNILAQNAENICEVLNTCKKSADIPDTFVCYANAGTEVARTSYMINVNASDASSSLSEQYRLVENQENVCTNETKRTYEARSDQTYDGLNNCILGISEVPTEAPSTEAPSTEASSTEAPSTDSPTTEAPSTEAPSTAAPSTDEPSLEDSSANEDSIEDILPEEDISILRSMKKLRHRLLQQYRN